MTIALASWAQSFNIGGHRAVQDNRYNRWICSIPQSLFGNDYTTTVSYGDSISQFAIEGTAIESGNSITFDSIAGNKDYTVTFYLGDSLVTGDVTFTWLPIVELNGEFGDEYTYGDVTVSEPDSAYAEPLMAKVKWRGQATNSWAKHKRNYRIKFVNPADSTKENHRFFGLRNDNSWILDAGQMDFLRVRNRVSTDLWLDMSRRPWYSDTLPNCHNGSRGTMVEVLLNGKYVGIYNMCEPIDRKQLKLKRYDEVNNEFHGALWMAYTWTRTVTMSDPASRDSEKDERYWDGFEVKYPDPDNGYGVTWDILDEAVKFAGRANGNKQLIADSLGYYYDIPVMQDYYIFIATLQALDNESKNIFYGCYDINDNRRLTMTPWDLDICLGQNYAPGVNLPDMVKPERDMSWVSHLPMSEMITIDQYRDEINERYQLMRLDILHTDSLVNRYRSVINDLENCGAAAREEQRWSRDKDLAFKKLDLSSEMDNVENWIRRRMAYLDENGLIPPIPDPQPVNKYDVNQDGEVNITDLNIIIDCILTGAENTSTDVTEDGETNISDVNDWLNYFLNMSN